MFDPEGTRVALIRKNKPAWQKGKLNGIGGKIEPGEDGAAAMVREFREETGCETTLDRWRHFLTMRGGEDGGWRVEFFVAIGDLSQVRSAESEIVEIVWLEQIHAVRPDMVENLPWLIPLALDHLHDGRPAFVDALYS